MNDTATRAVLNGHAPNPNLQVHRRGPNQNKRTRDGQPVNSTPRQSTGGANAFVPSLTAHLLNSNATSFTAATEQPFLSHAGCGTLAAGPLGQWMVQDAHYTRGHVQFIGALIAKIRLPVVPNSQFHPLYRTLDLLISALNNIRREMSFFEITATKYGITMAEDPPNPITRAYLDLFTSSSSSGSSLLEGLVVLWATGHVSDIPGIEIKRTYMADSFQCYRTAWWVNLLYQPPSSLSKTCSTLSEISMFWWLGDVRQFWEVFPMNLLICSTIFRQYCSTFSTSLAHPTTEPHIAALHQSLIPNWTAPAFYKFVDACRALVDELANSTTSPNGREEMARCEQVFRQICWIQERFWPDVDGMGEEDERGAHGHNSSLSAGGLGVGDAGSFGSALNGITEAAATGTS
jgi:thiaminase